MNATQKRRVRNNSLRGFRYTVEGLDYTNTTKQVDDSAKGQYAKAAQILLREYADREAVRNIPQVINQYNQNKHKYTGIDPVSSGRTDIDKKPPPDWPLSEDAWARAVYNPPFSLIDTAMGYSLYEKERLSRQHHKFKTYGVDALDEDQVKRLEKTKEKDAYIRRRNWRNRVKAGNQEAADAEDKTTLAIIGNYFTDQVVEVNPIPYPESFDAAMDDLTNGLFDE